MKRPMDDIFYGDRERYACLNWGYHLEAGVRLGGENLTVCLERVPLIDILARFMSMSMDVWLNTSLLEGYPQLRVLRSAILTLKVGHIVILSRGRNLTKSFVKGLGVLSRFWANIGTFRD